VNKRAKKKNPDHMGEIQDRKNRIIQVLDFSLKRGEESGKKGVLRGRGQLARLGKIR